MARISRRPANIPAISVHLAATVDCIDTPIDKPVHASALPNSNNESPKLENPSPPPLKIETNKPPTNKMVT